MKQKKRIIVLCMGLVSGVCSEEVGFCFSELCEVCRAANDWMALTTTFIRRPDEPEENYCKVN